MRQLFPIFQTTAPEGTAQALPLYWDVDMDYDKGVPRFEVLPKSWTKVMRQSHFEFCIGQDLTHSIFL